MAGSGGGEKRCLYEVLGVDSDSSPDDIRAAYKRLALQYHPDKAAASGIPAETATARFQEILNAYEVLSDHRERAWYDSHRSQILFSNPRSSSGAAGDFSDVLDDLFPFFSNSSYSGFSDSGKGFYKVYGDLFGTIYVREVKFAGKMGMGTGAVRESPVIGNSDSPYSQVTAFYAYWMGFCTVLDFAWVEEYKSAAGWSRKARRVMEEENKKSRRKAKREYNETVRGLAEFVKKRDKRVIEMVAKRHAEEEERKAKEKARKEAEAKARAEQARAYKEQEWARTATVEEEFDHDEFEGEEGRKQVELYCVICSKKFKSEKQWANHEKSKKHKDKVAELRYTFQREDEEEEELDGFNENVVIDNVVNDNVVDENVVDGDDISGLCEELEEKGVINEHEVEANGVGGGEEDDFDVEEDMLEAMISQRMSREQGLEQHLEIEPSSGDVHIDESDQEDPTDNGPKKKPRRRRARKEPGGDVLEGSAKTDASGEAKLKIDKTNVDEIQSDKSKKVSKSQGSKGPGQKDENARSKNQSKGKKQKVQQLHFLFLFINLPFCRQFLYIF